MDEDQLTADDVIETARAIFTQAAAPFAAFQLKSTGTMPLGPRWRGLANVCIDAAIEFEARAETRITEIDALLDAAGEGE
jgi:hypothetical protein